MFGDVEELRIEREGLIERREKAIEYRGEVIDIVQELAGRYGEGEISYYDYKERLEKILKGRDAEELVEYYDKYIELCNKKIKSYDKRIRKEKVLKKIAVITPIFLVIVLALLLMQSSIDIPRLLLSPPSIESYTQSVGVEFSESESYNWSLENVGRLGSVRVSGSLEGSGEAKIYLVADEREFLIFDSSLEVLFSPELNDTNVSFDVRDINLTNSDVTNVGDVADFNITTGNVTTDNNGTEIIDVNESGGLVNDTNGDINDTNVGVDVSSANDTNVGESVIGDVNATTSDVIGVNVTAIGNIRSFESVCEESCELFSFNLLNDSYEIRVEIDNVNLTLSEINYEIFVEGVSEVNETKVGNVTYREVELKDISQLVDMYNKGLNKGVWSDLPPQNISAYGLIAGYTKWEAVHGDNLLVSVSERDGKIESMMVSWVRDDSVIRLKSMILDVDIPQEEWNRIVYDHAIYMSDWGKSKGGVSLESQVIGGTWSEGFVRDIMGSTPLGEGKYELLNLEEFYNLDIDSFGVLDYQGGEIRAEEIQTRALEEFEEERADQQEVVIDGEIVGEHTIRKGNKFLIYSSPIAYEINGELKEIDLDIKNHRKKDGYDIEHLDVKVDEKGDLDYNGLKIELSEIYTNNGDSVKDLGNVKEKIKDRDSVVFEDVLQGIDSEFVISSDGFKLNTVFDEKPNFVLRDLINDRMYVKYEVNGNKNLLNEIIKEKGSDFIAFDSEGRETYIDYEIVSENGKTFVVESLPLGWMMEEAVYPVTLDPVFSEQASNDLYAWNGDVDKDRGCWLLKFPLDDIGYTSGQSISSAELKLTYFNKHADNNPVMEFYHFEMDPDWLESWPVRNSAPSDLESAVSFVPAPKDINGMPTNKLLDTQTINQAVIDGGGQLAFDVLGDGTTKGVDYAINVNVNGDNSITFAARGNLNCNFNVDYIETFPNSNSFQIGDKKKTFVEAYSSEAVNNRPVLEVITALPNSPPTINFISEVNEDFDSDSIPASPSVVDPVAGGTARGYVSFIAEDSDGVGDLANAGVEYKLGGVTNVGICSVEPGCVNCNVNEQNYSCYVDMNYYNSPDLNWVAEVSITDSVNPAVKCGDIGSASCVNFEYTSTSGIDNDGSVSWSTLSLSSLNQEADGPIKLFNRGNVNLNSVNVKAFDLKHNTGEYVIPSGEFRASDNQVSVCSAGSLAYNENIVVSVNLPYGSPGNDEDELFMCIPDITDLSLASGSYSANGVEIANDGLVSGATLVGGGGKYGDAYDFDGVDDYAKLFHEPSIYFAGLNEFSVGMWISVDDVDITDGKDTFIIFDDGDGAEPIRLDILQGTTTTNWRVGQDLRTNSGAFGSTSSVDHADGDGWHHIVYVYDSANAIVYVDDSVEINNPATGVVQTNTANNANWSIGSGERFGIGTNRYFNGKIDEVALWNRALTPSDVSELFNYQGNLNANDANLGQDNGLKALYHFDGDVKDWAIVGNRWEITIALALLVRVRRRKKKKRGLDGNELLDVLDEKLKERYGIGLDVLLDKTTRKDVKIPLEIFREGMGAAEVLAKYLKENENLGVSEIARTIKRDRRTIGVNYRNALKRKKGKIVLRGKGIKISIEVFADRRLSILESLVWHLRGRGYKNVEIAELIGRDARNVWTLYSRARKKLKVQQEK